MSLFLSIRDPGAGAPPPLQLAERDVIVGRAADADWTIPDPRVSSRHLIIGFRDGAYLVRDTSSNGTAVNGQPLTGIHRLAPGDVLAVGGTEILFGDAPVTPRQLNAPDANDLLTERLAEALGTLLATRRRQLGELRVTAPDALARNPLAQASNAAERLQAMPASAAAAAIDEAVETIERHHAAAVAAMQAGLRAVLANIAPDSLAATPDLPVRGEAREVALWRAYVARFNGEKGASASFIDRFAEAFRDNYERLAAG